MQQPGRPEAGQHVAVKVVGRAVHLVSFALKRAAEAGVPFERLVELTAWEPDLVREGLERPVPEPRVVARLAPDGVDPQAVARAAAAFDAIRHLHELTQRVLADADLDVDARPLPAPADLDDLSARLKRPGTPGTRHLIPRRPRPPAPGLKHYKGTGFYSTDHPKPAPSSDTPRDPAKA